LRRDEQVLDAQQDGHERSDDTTDEHGRADHAVRPHAEQPRGVEVRRRGTHLQPQPRPIEEEREQPRAGDGQHDREDRHLVDVQAADADHVDERGDRDRGLPDQRVVLEVHQECNRLEHERDREGRHEHHGGRGAAQRAEDREFHEHREADHDREAEDDRQPRGQRLVPEVVRRLRPEREHVRAGHDELAVGEVHEAEHTEDEPDTERHQGVHRTEADRVDDRLRVDRCAEGTAHAR
jgi:hypothetical protein